MKKLRIFIFVSIIIFLIMSLSIVSKADQIKRETAKTKLEQAIKEVTKEQNTIDISQVKDKIKNDVDNSKIVNEDSNKFPVYTKVDGYDFKVEEDGKVEHADNVEVEQSQENNNNEINNVQNNNENNNLENNNIEGNNVEEENQEKDETLVKYIDDIKTDKGITISTTKDGIITMNGKSTEKLFIKISNGIFITDNITRDFDNWKNEERSFNRKRKKYKTKCKYARKYYNRKRTNKCSFKDK